MPKTKDDAFVLEGRTEESLKGGLFRITLDNGHEVLGHLSGKMRKNRIRILPGDTVPAVRTNAVTYVDGVPAV